MNETADIAQPQMLLRTKIALFATAILVSLSFILLLFGEIKAEWANDQFESALLDGDDTAISTITELDSRFLSRVSLDLRDRPEIRRALQIGTSGAATSFLREVQDVTRFLDPQPNVFLLSPSFTVLTSTVSDVPGNFANVLEPLFDGRARSFSGVFRFPRTGSLLLMFVQEIRLRDNVAGYLVTGLDFRQRSRILLRDNTAILFVAHDQEPQLLHGSVAQGFIETLACCHTRPNVVEWTGPDGAHLVATVNRLVDPNGTQMGDFYVVRDLTEQKARQELLSRLSYAGVALFILIAVSLLIWSLRTSLRPLSTVVEVLRALSKGDTSTGLRSVKTSREIGTLADTVESFRTGQQAREELLALNEQISSASRIQQTILPREFDLDPTLDIHAVMQPAQDIGGDFFDIFRIDKERICILVADVAGKGIGSALFASNASAMLRAYAPLSKTTAEVIALVNRELCKRNDEGLFITLFLAILDTKTGEFAFTNAGHGQPFLIRLDGQVSTLPMTGDMVLGFFDDVEYGYDSIRLTPGQTIVIYSDGFDESMNPKGELLGLERATHIVKSVAGLQAGRAIELISEAIAWYENGAKPADDITLVALRWDPARAGKPEAQKNMGAQPEGAFEAAEKAPEPAE